MKHLHSEVARIVGGGGVLGFSSGFVIWGVGGAVVPLPLSPFLFLVGGSETGPLAASVYEPAFISVGFAEAVIWSGCCRVTMVAILIDSIWSESTSFGRVAMVEMSVMNSTILLPFVSRFVFRVFDPNPLSCLAGV